MNGKKELREKILGIRRSMSREEVMELSEEICRKLLDTDIYRTASDICVYMPINNEADTSLIVSHGRMSGKNIWIPKICGEEMLFNAYESDARMVKGRFGIRESLSSRVLVPGGDTLVVMPGAVFSVDRDRIGYGGGYYDRFLERNYQCRTAAICFDFQIQKEVPSEMHDRKPDMIVTERKIYTGLQQPADTM